MRSANKPLQSTKYKGLASRFCIFVAQVWAWNRLELLQFTMDIPVPPGGDANRGKFLSNAVMLTQWDNLTSKSHSNWNHSGLLDMHSHYRIMSGLPIRR
jgi:hypothetical protein